LAEIDIDVKQMAQRFGAVRVACNDNGVARWNRDDTSNKRFMFHVRDTDNYQSAMTKAMKTLLMALP